MSTKGDKTGNDDEDEDNNLDNTKEVLETETPLQGGSVQEPCKGDAGEADESQSPSRWLNIGSSKNVFTEDERVPSRPSCIDYDHGERKNQYEIQMTTHLVELHSPQTRR
jgi:hypothetical protein